MSSSMGTVMSGSLREASRRARALYRRTMRAVPSIVTGYELECTPAQLRAAVRARFAQHSALQDPAVIDVLVFKGEHEYQETLQMWKTKAHVQKYVASFDKASEGQFADEFFKGYKVEEWTWPPQNARQ